MKIQFLTLVAIFATMANAADTTSSAATIKPTAVIPAPPGVVCAMVVCPSSSVAKRDTAACPVICPNDCKVIADICCPGQMKAVCNTNSTSASGSGSVPVATAASSTMIMSSAMPTMMPSASASANASVSSAAATPSKSAASYIAASVLSTCMLVTLLTIGLNQL